MNFTLEEIKKVLYQHCGKHGYFHPMDWHLLRDALIGITKQQIAKKVFEDNLNALHNK